MSDVNNNTEQKKDELNTFLFLTIFLAPFLAVAIVGVLGFSIWFSQLIMGPPGV
ncbi:periplasmic nitrate reductase, NapE protein [Thalassomonas sp. M1454]|uniref:periplasmic nitrate reductase, NapE protein n=1 Tax=Thalassomonas sp. M1454 TaxID=2594477 RepID=UPI00117DD08D|nr:periplasmic nitrate reductase, NapE protein [Thalassomonas sp. M1454]TRX54564.1 periplasmic nitrate reductase, NapE protein [Thalassomonas sp. M1454]